MSANRKFGIDTPSVVTTVITLFTHLSFARAAMIPRVRPMTIDVTKAMAPNLAVTGKRREIMSETCFPFLEIDSPKSPFAAFFRKIKYCSLKGLSRWNFSLSASYVSGAITLLSCSKGSPGIALTPKNVIVDNMRSVIAPITILLTMYFNILYSFQTRNDFKHL